MLECPSGFDFSLLVSSQVDHKASQWPQESDMGQKVAFLSAQCHSHDERLAELTVLLQKLQIRVDQVDDGREGLSLWVKDMIGQHLQEMGAIEPPDAKVRPRNFFGLVEHIVPSPCGDSPVQTPPGTRRQKGRNRPGQGLLLGHIPGVLLPLSNTFKHYYHPPVVSLGNKPICGLISG